MEKVSSHTTFFGGAVDGLEKYTGVDAPPKKRISSGVVTTNMALLRVWVLFDVCMWLGEVSMRADGPTEFGC